MFFKIILPLFLLAVVYFVGRAHARRRDLQYASAPAFPSLRENMKGPVGKIAVILVASTLLSALWMIFSHWQDNATWVEVRVVDVKSGEKSYYEAQKGQIHGRSFTTRDGRRITLSDVERMEIMTK
ncbi:MAG: hypothetical protein HQL76_08225 [Magnetococcales bacterium]|nr:hypothetical protein [Magnetococcales bacterium]